MKTYNGIPVLRYSLDGIEEYPDFEFSLLASHVESPAIAFDEFANKKNNYGTWVKNSIPKVKNYLNSKKMQVTSVLLSANSLVINEAQSDMKEFGIKKGQPYYGIATEEDVFKIVNEFKKNQKTNYIADIEHSDVPTKNAFLIEDWIVLNPNNDKASELGLKVNAGDYVQTHQITNKEYWKKIENGFVNGFSIAAPFLLTPLEDFSLIRNKKSNFKYKLK